MNLTVAFDAALICRLLNASVGELKFVGNVEKNELQDLMVPMVGRALSALGVERVVQLLGMMEPLRAQRDPIVFRRVRNLPVPRSNIDLFVQVAASLSLCVFQLLCFSAPAL